MKHYILTLIILGFFSCKKTDHSVDDKTMKEDRIENSSNTEKGLKFALNTQAVLGKNLMGKIQKEGTLAALKFCNIKAYPLTDSMAVVHNTTIKRVSDKPRNPNNIATEKENEYIKIFKNDAKQNKDSQPIVVENDTNVEVYYPIVTNGMCLKCHGNLKADIEQKTFEEIIKLYPNDKAIGYTINEVRGIWNVSFSK